MKNEKCCFLGDTGDIGRPKDTTNKGKEITG